MDSPRFAFASVSHPPAAEAGRVSILCRLPVGWLIGMVVSAWSRLGRMPPMYAVDYGAVLIARTGVHLSIKRDAPIEV